MGGRTHVANATRYNIWVQCDSDRHIMAERSQQVVDSYSEEYKKIFSDEDSASAGNIYIRRGRKWGADPQPHFRPSLHSIIFLMIKFLGTQMSTFFERGEAEFEGNGKRSESSHHEHACVKFSDS